MAYMISEDFRLRGPYPNKSGEFCGNEYPGSSGYRGDQGGYWAGAPSSCVAGTSAEMSAQGMVGIYLTRDKQSDTYLFPEKVREVDTDALQEAVVTGEREAQRPVPAAYFVRKSKAK